MGPPPSPRAQKDGSTTVVSSRLSLLLGIPWQSRCWSFYCDGQGSICRRKKKKSLFIQEEKPKYKENLKCFLLGNLTSDRNAGWRQGVRLDVRWDVAARMHFPDQISMLGILLCGILVSQPAPPAVVHSPFLYQQTKPQTTQPPSAARCGEQGIECRPWCPKGLD